MSFYYTVVKFFQDGGEFMYPIASVLVIGLAIGIERLIFISQVRKANIAAFEKIQPLLIQQDFKALIKFFQHSTAPLSQLIHAGFEKLTSTRDRAQLEYAMEEKFMETTPRLEKRTSYLALLANIATLLGLLGTIAGLIAAFSAVANADLSQKATLLSQSIAVAMNTTAFGLIVAIPLLMIHAYVTTKTAEVVDLLEVASIKFLNQLSHSTTSNH
jgi:biopolymer transport protein ExbB/TolQ